MYQNIKVDIIYYKTATDFEMEFNLSGCCRMRLLTDKSPDRKTLVNQLVRAVSRSRIIMIAGALFGDDGIISTCSKAIGRPLQETDNKQYGIASEDSIEIIENSIPLVSSNGIFGGCIIEQGPQTLILLSENKAVRKDIMQNLIHSYVKEICADELTEKSVDIIPNPKDVQPEVEDIEEELTEAVSDVEEISLEDKVETEIEVDESLTDTEDQQAEDLELLNIPDRTVIFNEGDKEKGELTHFPENEATEEDTKKDGDFDRNLYKDILFSKKAPQEGTDLNSEDTVMFKAHENIEPQKIIDNFEHHFYEPHLDIDYEDEDEIPKKKILNLNIPIIIIAIILLLVVGVLCYCIFFSSEMREASIGAGLKEIFNTLFG